jgi:hypothetical protein
MISYLGEIIFFLLVHAHVCLSFNLIYLLQSIHSNQSVFGILKRVIYLDFLQGQPT